MIELHRRARASARHYGFSVSQDDIAQEVVCRILEGKGKHQTINQAVIDAIRKDYGRTPRALPPDKVLQDNSVLQSFVSSLAGVKRSVISLTYEWGFDLKEIGHVLGMTSSRVCQIKAEALAMFDEGNS